MILVEHFKGKENLSVNVLLDDDNYSLFWQTGGPCGLAQLPVSLQNKILKVVGNRGHQYYKGLTMLNIKQLQKLAKFTIKDIVSDAGLNINNIRSKIQFGRELKVDESQALEKAIEKFGIKMKEEENENK